MADVTTRTTNVPELDAPRMAGPGSLPSLPNVRRRKFSVAEYRGMAEAGILRPDERTELLAGEVIPVASASSQHSAAVTRLDHFLTLRLQERALVRPQCPFELDDYSLPEPDLAVLVFRSDFYAKADPVPADALLLMEVGVSSVRFDRYVKAPLYAKAGVKELWLIDLPGQAVVVCREPAGDEFGHVIRHERGATLTVPGFPDVTLTVDVILG
jgi:Uma2 family endonuclease